MLRIAFFWLLAGVGILAFGYQARAQKSTDKFPHAIERSQDAARVVPLLAVVPEDGVPKELLDKAEAIGVFPKVTRDTVYFTHMIQGYGVISARQENGWTMPAFYQFMGAGYGNPFSPKENYGVVMLFMTRDAVDWFEKGGVPLKGEKKAIAGPVGTISDAQKKELEGAQLIAYAYYNGKVKGVDYGKHFGLNPDNKINMPLYGMKGREVLAGKKVDPAALPDGIAAFRDALQKYYPSH